LKVAQIGTGGWGKNHTRILSQLNALAAICDLNEDNCKKYSTQYDVNGYTSIEELLKNEEFDAAVICTPTSTHFNIASQFITAGKHVFVEKPLTYHSSEGVKMLNLAKENDVLLTCGYIERFNPAVANVKKYVKEKSYGELIMLEFVRENRMPMHIKDVGIIYDTMVHDIDTAMWLFDAAPSVVFARSGKLRHEHEDFATIMLGFNNNKSAILYSNWITPSRIRKFSAVLTEGRISSDFITQEIEIEDEKGKFIPHHQFDEPLLKEIQNFIGACKGEVDLVVKPEQAVLVTKVAEAALKSSKEHRPIEISQD